MDTSSNQTHRRSRGELPSWMISTGLHAFLLIGLWLFGFLPASEQTLLLLRGDISSPSDEELEIMELEAVSAPPTSPSPTDGHDVSSSEDVGALSDGLVTVEMVAELDTDASPSPLATLLDDTQGDLVMVHSRPPLSEALDGRSRQRKEELLKKYGGSAESEAAVQRALNWLAAHQAYDGGWSFAHHQVCQGQCDAPGRVGQARNGATGIALLPFLGAGHTHLTGEYIETVHDGLRYLINHVNRANAGAPMAKMLQGSWFEPGGRMYSHCLATIALCEAYAMTKDSSLRAPAQSGIDFLIRAQNKVDGGWRYLPGDRGDTSVVGWAVMALKSGRIGGLEVPETTLTRAYGFFDTVSSNNGRSYGYTSPKNPNGLAATTSIGVLCRMYQGWPKTHLPLRRGVSAIAETGPSTTRLYYSYYATQVMHHYGGDEWTEWNARMRDPLIQRQVKRGHAAGSWAPTNNLDGSSGGRLYATAMSTMILEIYYRHMPLYTEQVFDDLFQL